MSAEWTSEQLPDVPDDVLVKYNDPVTIEVLESIADDAGFDWGDITSEDEATRESAKDKMEAWVHTYVDEATSVCAAARSIANAITRNPLLMMVGADADLSKTFYGGMIFGIGLGNRRNRVSNELEAIPVLDDAPEYGVEAQPGDDLHQGV